MIDEELGREWFDHNEGSGFYSRLGALVRERDYHATRADTLAVELLDMKARAEKAEALVEVRKMQMRGDLKAIDDLTERAEKAEAECKRLRDIAMEAAEYATVHRREWLRAKIDQREPRPVRCTCCPDEAALRGEEGA